LTAKHAPGLENRKADCLNRISAGGDYGLTEQATSKILSTWQVQIGADLFAEGWNRKHNQYCLLAKDRNALGRDAFTIQWSTFALPLLHSPIPLIPKALKRLQQEHMKAIMIVSRWSRQTWSQTFSQMSTKELDLG
jgi:hypothetical protein